MELKKTEKYNMQHKLAIVIPAYKAKYLSETLDSIASQTDKRFCVYIGDDCSPEKIDNIVSQYKDKFNYVYQHFDTNLGGKDLVAQWEMGYPYHSVTYDLGGGSGEAPTQDDVQEHSKFTVKMYSGTKDGYSFGGWEYNGKTYQMGEKVEMGTSNITLVAVWNANKTFWEQNGVGLIVGGILTVAAAAGVVFFLIRRY